MKMKGSSMSHKTVICSSNAVLPQHCWSILVAIRLPITLTKAYPLAQGIIPYQSDASAAQEVRPHHVGL
jgi:hypothetical protein